MFPLKDNIPTERTPIVTIAFIAINVLVYFFLQDGGWELTSNTAGDWPVAQYAAVPCELTNDCAIPGNQPDLVTVFTAMFMHGSILHLGGNMLFLWIFGNNVEDACGRLRFIAFYLLGGVAAIALQVAFNPGSDVPTLGASGAVAAVLGGYILLYPRARVVTVIFIIIFFTIIELPALLVLGLWFVQQVLFSAAEYTSGGQAEGGVAYFAHIGGFLFGLLTIRLLANEDRIKRVPMPRRRPVF